MTTPKAAIPTIASTIMPAIPAAEMPEPVVVLDLLLMLVAAPPLEAAVWAVVLSVLAVLGAVVVVGAVVALDFCSVDDPVVVDVCWFVKVDPVSELALTVPGADSSVFSELCLVESCLVESCLFSDPDAESDVEADVVVFLSVFVAVDESPDFEVVDCFVDPVLPPSSLELVVDVSNDDEVGAAVVALGVSVAAVLGVVAAAGAFVAVVVDPVELVPDPFAMARACSINTVCMLAT